MLLWLVPRRVLCDPEWKAEAASMAMFLCSSDVCLLYPAPDSMPLCTHTYNSNQGTFDRERRHLINKLGVVGQDCPEKPGIYNHPGNITSFLSVLLKSHLLY